MNFMNEYGYNACYLLVRRSDVPGGETRLMELLDAMV